jgi:hypothetical protein
MKGGYPPFVDKNKLIPLEEKWNAEQRACLEQG